MKQRITEVMDLAYNLELVMKDDKEKFLAITTDTKKYDVIPLVNELATIYNDSKKVLVMSYNEIKDRVEGVDYVVVDAKKDSVDNILEKAQPYDVVLVVSPNMLTSKSYLHVAKYVKDIIFVVKKWKSKTDNVNLMKEIATHHNMNILGLVYEK